MRPAHRRVRVAQVVTRFIAGAGGVALRGAVALDPTRYDVTILAAPGGRLLGEAEAAGFAVRRLRHLVPELNPRADYLAYRELQAELLSGFDVVHTHSAKAGGLGRLAARSVGTPAIVHTYHGFPFHDFQSPLRRRAYIEVERRLGRITDGFLAIGSSIAADAVRLGLAAPEKVRVVASAITDGIRPATPESRAAARRKLGLPDSAQVVGTVGRLDFQKAPEDMLEAAAAVRSSVVFVWIGGGPLFERTRRAVEERGLGARFLLLGERDDVPELLPALDVFAMSSLYEGLPCAIAEAMTCGLPVVATAVNGVPEAVIPGQTGLLVGPRRPRGLASALEWMLDHPAAAARMARAGRAHIGNRFSPALLGRELEEVYETALALSGSVAERDLRAAS